MRLICVGGNFNCMDTPCPTDIHLLLDPCHTVTRLIIKDADTRLLHPGPNRVFAEIRCQYWILRGRQAVKHHQRNCTKHRNCRGKPVVLVKQVSCLHVAPETSILLQGSQLLWAVYDQNWVSKSNALWSHILSTRCVHLESLSNLTVDAF